MKAEPGRAAWQKSAEQPRHTSQPTTPTKSWPSPPTFILGRSFHNLHVTGSPGAARNGPKHPEDFGDATVSFRAKLSIDSNTQQAERGTPRIQPQSLLGTQSAHNVDEEQKRQSFPPNHKTSESEKNPGPGQCHRHRVRTITKQCMGPARSPMGKHTGSPALRPVSRL